jgi:ACDE family multidrug resistance protein
LTPAPSLLRQPKAVWAVAFACVVAFMGIGLVDPILPVLAKQLDAGPSQVSLLFTSYFAVTGVSMLVTGWVSSRLGAKRTLLGGLALVIAFSALAGLSGSVGEIVGFRAGWGLGNALFIATALSVIVGAASGGVSGAIILYEAALGLGIASGPLLGGFLGGISWRGPFFGVAVLMAVAFIAITGLLQAPEKPAQKLPARAPLAALKHRGLLLVGVMAIFYNFGFFTLLAYTPFPLHMGAHALGFVFFGWGLMVAFFSVVVAPVVKRRLGVPASLGIAYTLFSLNLLALAIGIDSQAVLAVGVIVAGAFSGIVNTVLTEAVMKVAPVERPTASASYSFMRFTGGAVAPWLAGRLAEHVSAGMPFYVAAVAVAAALVVLAAARRDLHASEEEAPAAEPVVAPLRLGPVVAAVDASPAGERVSAAAARAALARGTTVNLVHVRENRAAIEGAVVLESDEVARETIARNLRLLADRGVSATGDVVSSFGDHDDAADQLLAHARQAGATLLVVGAPSHSVPLARSLADTATDEAPCDVLIVRN